MMNFDDRSGRTQPVINALEQQTASSIQSLASRKKLPGSGLYSTTVTPDQVSKAVIGKPRSL